MELWIIRHGDALAGLEDPPLSQEGRSQVLKRLQSLRYQPKSEARLFVSPLKRAEQTAAIFNELWKLSQETVEWLRPGQGAPKILEALAAQNLDSAVLVGHLPTLAWLASVLLEGLPPQDWNLPPASILSLELKNFRPGDAELKWSFL